MTPHVNYDEWGEVINGPETFKAVAQHIAHGGSAFIGWNDGDVTHLDILFSLTPVKAGLVQGGLNQGQNLFVSIMRIGAFGFDINNPDTHPNYYAQKLGITGSVTIEKLAELIDGIKEAL